MANPHGVVACNPPDDARLAADPALYRALGDALKRARRAGARHCCGDFELAKATGLRANKRYQLFNGLIECSLIVCDPVAPPQRETAPRELSDGARMVANRLRKNLDRLARWRQQEGVACFRAYDADIPEHACAVDAYTGVDGDTWLHVQEYAAPAEIPEATTRKRLNELLSAAREVFAVPRERVAVKTRSTGKGGSGYGRFDHRGEFLVVEEGARQAQVNLFDYYLDTGLFLDHRPLRARMALEARGKRFLNLFCYTGAATVQAAQGAAQTTSVDLSATYLEWLADNLRENGHRRHPPSHRPGRRAALDRIGPRRIRRGVLRPADLLQLQARRRLRRAARPCAPAARDRANAGAGRRAVFLQQLPPLPGSTKPRCPASPGAEDISASTIPPDFARNPRIHRAWRIAALHEGDIAPRA